MTFRHKHFSSLPSFFLLFQILSKMLIFTKILFPTKALKNYTYITSSWMKGNMNLKIFPFHFVNILFEPHQPCMYPICYSNSGSLWILQLRPYTMVLFLCVECCFQQSKPIQWKCWVWSGGERRWNHSTMLKTDGRDTCDVSVGWKTARAAHTRAGEWTMGQDEM